MLDRKIILTVGLPRSGKSTWARKQGIPIVSPDAVRLALHGQQYNRQMEPMVWVIARYMVVALFEAGHTTVIVDATNYHEERRAEWEKLAPCECVCFSTSVEECKRRAILTEQPHLIPVIDRMASGWDYEVPLDVG